MIKLTELPKKMKLMLALQGDAGTGKTYSVSTLPDVARPALVLDFEKGAKSLLHADTNEDIYVLEFDDYIKFGNWFKKFKKNGCIEDGTQIKTLVLDSWTTKSEMQKDWVFDIYKPEIKGDKYRDQRAVWGEHLQLDRKLLMQLISLPCHVLIIFHRGRIMSEAGGLIKYIPITYGQASHAPEKILQNFDEFYMAECSIPAYSKAEEKKAAEDRKKAEFWWITRGSLPVTARTRGDLPTKIEQNWALVFEDQGLLETK